MTMQVFDPHLTIIRPKQGIVRRDPVVRKFMYQCLHQQIVGYESFEVIWSKFDIDTQTLWKTSEVKKHEHTCMNKKQIKHKAIDCMN